MEAETLRSGLALVWESEKRDGAGSKGWKRGPGRRHRELKKEILLLHFL